MASVIIRTRRTGEDARDVVKTIIRRSKEAPPVGKDWPLAMHPGYPHLESKYTMHVIEIEGQLFTFLWDHQAGMWSTGLTRYSPATMSQHDYHGECTIVYRRSSIPDPTQSYRRR
jgi:hypothetical protein